MLRESTAAVNAAVVNVLAFDVAVQGGELFRNGGQCGIQVFGLGVQIFGDDEFSSLGQLGAAVGVAQIIAVAVVGCGSFLGRICI